MYHIIINEESETDSETGIVVERYSQRVDAIDMQSIIAAVNKGPKKVRADAGVPRKPKTEGAK